MDQIALVGYPNVGKTTLFNAVTGLSALTAPHPYATTEPNLGTVAVPDPGLDQIAALEGSAKVTPARLALTDFPALTHRGSGHGLGPQLLGKLREVDAVINVLRAFADLSVPFDESGLDPSAQAENLLLETALADLEVLARRRDRLAKEGGDPATRLRLALLARALDALEEGRPLRALHLENSEQAALSDLGPISLKPTAWVVNRDEDDATDYQSKLALPAGDPAVSLSAKLEEEAARLSAEEKAEYSAALGLGEGAVASIVRACYSALGLITFYTVGPKESRAWTIRRGSGARQAAGKIHSDLERGFIRAEVAGLVDVLAAGGWEAAKQAGKVRVEGKDYVVVDGDVLLVRFSV